MKKYLVIYGDDYEISVKEFETLEEAQQFYDETNETYCWSQFLCEVLKSK